MIKVMSFFRSNTNNTILILIMNSTKISFSRKIRFIQILI